MGLAFLKSYYLSGYMYVSTPRKLTFDLQESYLLGLVLRCLMAWNFLW